MKTCFPPLTLLLLLLSISAYSQSVGIGTNTPNTSAKLHIEATNRGLLIPRVALVDITNGTTPVNTPAISLLVYNTNATVTGGAGTGFYYWNGTVWTKLQDQIDHDWYEVGTTIAPDNINDNIYTQGNVGIGMAAPEEALVVHGITRLIGQTATDSADQRIVLEIGTNPITNNAAAVGPDRHFRIITETDVVSPARDFLIFEGLDANNINQDGGFIFRGRNTSGTARNIMTLLGNGLVGIGVINPQLNLDVLGSGRFQNATGLTQSYITSDGGIELYRDPTAPSNYHGYVDFKDNLAKDADFRLSYLDQSGFTIAYNPAGNFGAGTAFPFFISSLPNNTGYVGLNTTVPDARLHVTSGGNAANNYTAKFVSSPSVGGSGGIVFTNTEAAAATGFKWHTTQTGVGTYTNDNLILSSVAVTSGATNQNNLFTITGSGNIGLGVVNAVNPIQHSSGARLTAAGTWANASDRRLKTAIQPSKYGLETVLKLRPVDYLLKNNQQAQVGFIAQEVQKLVPEVVDGKAGAVQEGETLAIAYGQLVPVLTKAIQEQEATIQAQAQKIKALEANNNQQANTVQQLETRLSTMNERLEDLESLLQKTAQKK